MSELNEEPPTHGPPDPSRHGTGDSDGRAGTDADRSWFDDVHETGAPRDAERDEEWIYFHAPSEADLPLLREITTPTETNRAEQVAPPSAGRNGGDTPAPAPHDAGREAGPTDTRPNARSGAEQQVDGRGPASHREGPWPVTPLWPDVAETEEPPRPPREGSPPPVTPGDTGAVAPGDAPAVAASGGTGAGRPPRRMPRFAPAHQPLSGQPASGNGHHPPQPPGFAPPPGHPQPVAPTPPPPPPGAAPHHAPAPGPARPTGYSQPGNPAPPVHGPPTGYGAHPGPPGVAPRPAPHPSAHGPPGGATHPGGQVRFLPPSAPAADGPPGHPPVAAPVPPPKPQPDITQGTHRLHWATIPFRVLIATTVFLAVPGPVLIQFGPMWLLLSTLVVALVSAGYALMSWWSSSFGLHGDHLLVRTGPVRRSTREIPLSRLQAVDVVRPLLPQVLRLAELRVELAGGDASEIRLRYLGHRTAERLRASLLAHAAGLSGTTPEAPEHPFYRLSFARLFGALAFRLPVLGAVILLLVLVLAGLAFMEPGVLGGAVPLLLGLVRGFFGPLIRYTDFYASLSPDGLRLRYGMFQARMQTVPPGRVQAIRVVEPLLWRSLGMVRVEANVAGYVGERQMDSSTLLPVVPRRLAFTLINELFPGADAARVHARPGRRGWPRADSMGIDDSLFVTQRGILSRVVEIVPHARVQSIRLTAGPFSRRRGVADVDADTPPGPIRARAAGRGLVEARRAVDGMAGRSHAARMTSGGPERWATRSGEPERVE